MKTKILKFIEKYRNTMLASFLENFLGLLFLPLFLIWLLFSIIGAFLYGITFMESCIEVCNMADLWKFIFSTVSLICIIAISMTLGE